MLTLVYQAYGQKAIYQEAALSILTWLHQPGSAASQVLVYTDAPEALQAMIGTRLNVFYQPVSADQWQAWRGEIDFVHRVKICVLQDALMRVAGPLLYLDTDTVWTAPADTLAATLAAGRRLMHLKEGSLAAGNALNRKIYKALSGQVVKLENGDTFQANATLMMYNAGVLGLLPQDAPLLAIVLALTEALYRALPKHVMEQLAFSYVLQQAGPVDSADGPILHYWNLKALREQLPAFFENLQTLAPEVWPAAASALGQELIAPYEAELAYRGLPGWRRAFLKLAGGRWQMPDLQTARPRA